MYMREGSINVVLYERTDQGTGYRKVAEVCRDFNGSPGLDVWSGIPAPFLLRWDERLFVREGYELRSSPGTLAFSESILHALKESGLSGISARYVEVTAVETIG